jgi:hypothetical protein
MLLAIDVYLHAAVVALKPNNTIGNALLVMLGKRCLQNPLR